MSLVVSPRSIASSSLHMSSWCGAGLKSGLVNLIKSTRLSCALDIKDRISFGYFLVWF